jgi:hypothetical protein
MSSAPEPNDSDSIVMKDDEIAHLAGFFDGSGSISAGIRKDDEYALGYAFEPRVRLRLNNEDKILAGVIDHFCEEQGVRYYPNENKDSLVFEINDPTSVERFLSPLMNWLIAMHDPASVMIDRILPILMDGPPEDQAETIVLMGYIDAIRSRNHIGREATYTQEYFEELWDFD